MSRRARIASRAGLIALAVAALPLGALWYVATALLSSSHESACQGETAADAAWIASHVGIALAILALVAAIMRRLQLGWSALAIYAGLFAASLFVLLTCE